MKLLKNIKKINYRHYIMTAFVLASLLCSVFVFHMVFARTVSAFKDFGSSIAYYFCTLFSIPNNIKITILEIPKNFGESLLPFSYSEFKLLMQRFWQVFFTGSNFLEFFNSMFDNLYNFLLLVTVLIPLVIVVFILLNNTLKKENNNYNKDSKPLKAYKFFENKIILPIKKFLSSFISFVSSQKVYVILLLVIWAYNFNLFTIIIEAFAFYFYFVTSFDFLHLYTQLVKLFIDLTVIVRFMPIWVWLLISFIIILQIRKNIAYNHLNHNEMKDRGLINSIGIVNLIVGAMGVKKTTIITDMNLSTEVMFRDKAYELILENDLKFPNFPWINLENEIKRMIKLRQIYNLATCKAWADKRKKRFYNNSNKVKCFDYDYVKYGLTYDDKLKTVDLFDVIKTYTQLYFIYIIEGSLTVSNYAIREDNIISDTGNFPFWDTDFFHRDSKRINEISKHSHILDFDTLRLGKKIIEYNKKAGSFEFGVVMITEVGKERGNMVENKDVKSDSAQANQKNDYFNKWLKMARHSATVDNYPFIKVIMDEQRPESLGADARELAQIVHVEKTNDFKLAMPFFFIEELLYSFIFASFEKVYSTYRYYRGDNTLFVYLIKNISSKIDSYYKGVYNRFSYAMIDLNIESGTLDGNIKKTKYILMPKKIYSKRFGTDCFSDFFNEKAKNTKYGIEDYETYKTEKASFYELKEQNSYFMNDLLGVNKNTKENKK